MKRNKTISLLTILLATIIFNTYAYGQEFQGLATYTSDRDMSEFDFQGDGMTPKMVENLKAQLKKQFQKEYELRFNLTESTWKEAESLDAGPATATAGGMVMSISFGSGISYKNTETKDYLQQTEAFSKLFLIEGQLENREWIMTGKSKKIGNYEAYEAVFEQVRELQTIAMSDAEKSQETITDTTRVSVWYTPEIPVPHGPEGFWGLPGLILELRNGEVTYLCTKIELNPDKPIEIKKPKKGKRVTEEKFRQISQEQAQKMMKKYTGDGDGEENVMTIRIGN